MEIHQVLVSASPADAVTDSAFRLRSLLRQVGPSEIYSLHVHPGVAGDVRRLFRYPPRRERPGHEQHVLIFHASIGEPEVLSFLLASEDRLVVMYHNITPAPYFEGVDPTFARLLESGRAELRFLRDKVELALAVSAFNAAELLDMGYRDVRVAPLLVDVGGTPVEPDEGIAPELTRLLGEGPTLLYVGQLQPHKRIDLLLQAYSVMTTHLLPEARLVVAGLARLKPYRTALERLVHQLGLYKATLTGHITPAQLEACWQVADVFVTASEHEGFCMPLAEAMAHQVPIVARSCAAIPETVGDAALLVDADAGPELLAEAMAELLSSAPLRDELNRRAAVRVQAFDPDRAAETFLRHVLSVV